MSVMAMDVLRRQDAESRTEYLCSERESAGSEDYFVGAIDDLGSSAWVGGLAQRMGLDGLVKGDDLGAVLQGIHPGTGEPLGSKRLPKEPWMAHSGGLEALPQKEKESAERSWVAWRSDASFHTFGLDEYVNYVQERHAEEKAIENPPKRPNPQNNDKVAYEMAISVDKSITAYYAVSDDETKRMIESAMNASADAMLEFAVEKGYIQVQRRNGKKVERIPAEEILAARFLHCTSRNLDPNLHVHIEISAFARADGRNMAIEPEELFKRQSELRYVYDAALAQKFQASGIRCKAVELGLAIPGQPEELLQKWSSRRSEILAATEAGDFGRAGNVRAWRSTRKNKADDALSQGEMFEKWAAEAAQIVDIDEMRETGRRSSGSDELIDELPIEEIEDALLDNASVFTERDWDRVAAKLAIGHGVQDTILEVKRRMREAADVVHIAGEYYSTRKIVEMERAVMSSAVGRASEVAHEVDLVLVKKVLESYPTLRDEQRSAVLHMLGPGGINIVEGAAGTGKSFSLRAVGEAYEAAGFRVSGLAPSGTAAAELQDGSGIESGTLSSLLLRIEKGRATLSKQDVLVLDEAGMVSSNDLARLVDAAHTAGAKIILTGDSKQLEAVGTGNLLTQIKKEIGSSDLTEIARQKGGLRQISDDFFALRGQVAMNKLREEIPRMALPQEATIVEETSHQKFAETWSEGQFLKVSGQTNTAEESEKIQAERAKNGDFRGGQVFVEGDRWYYKGEPVRIAQSSVELGITQDEYATITDIGRDEVTISGVIGEKKIPRAEIGKIELAYAIDYHAPKIFETKTAAHAIDEAASRHIENIKAVGAEEALLLADTNAQVRALNDAVRKKLIDEKTLLIDQGETCSWKMESGESRKEVFIPGDRVMFRKNQKEMGVYNGTTGALVSVQGNNLSIKIDEGGLIDVDLNEYGEINLAWAMTTHKSQGMTVEKATHLVTDRTDNRLAYVGYTRARQGADLVGSEEHLEAFYKNLEKPKAKHTTISLIQEGKEKSAFEPVASQAVEPQKKSAVGTVLSDAYRPGVIPDITKNYEGEKMATTARAAEILRRRRQNHQRLASVI